MITLFTQMMGVIEAEEALHQSMVMAVGSGSLKESASRSQIAQWRSAVSSMVRRQESVLDAAQLASLGVGVEVEKK